MNIYKHIKLSQNIIFFILEQINLKERIINEYKQLLVSSFVFLKTNNCIIHDFGDSNMLYTI